MKKPGVLTVDNEQEKTGYSHLAFSVGSKEKVDELTSLLVQDSYRVSCDDTDHWDRFIHGTPTDSFLLSI